MKYLRILAGFLLLVQLQGCFNQSIPGSGMHLTVSKDLQHFGSVAVYNDIDFIYTENNSRPTPLVKMTIDDNLAHFVNMQVIKGQLQVSLTQPVSTSKRLLEIEGPPLSGIQLIGLSRGTIKRWVSVNPVSIGLSGSAQMVVDYLEANSADFSVNSRSSLTVSGGAIPTVKLNMNDNAHFNGETLRTNQLEATLFERCSAKVNVLTLLSANLSNSSTVDYKGNPQIRENSLDRESRVRPIGQL